MAYSGFPDDTVDTYIAETHSVRNFVLDTFKRAVDEVIANEDVWYYKDAIIDDLVATVVRSYNMSEAEVRLYSTYIQASLSFRVPNNISTYTEPYILSTFRTGLHNCGFRSSPPEAW